MYLQGKYIHDITPEDLEKLITNEVKEGISLEYKMNLLIEGEKTEENRQEFFCDIAAMYNTSGGCIIYGIKEKKQGRDNTGYPEKFVPLEIKSQDLLSQKIHSLLNSSTDPSISNVAIKFLTVQDCLVLLIGVPRGLGYPSMVTFNNINRFYRRNTSGRYLVYTSELNQMFMQSQTLRERAESIRTNRINYVLDKERRNNRNINGVSFIHIIPFSFLEEKVYDITILDKHRNSLFPPFKVTKSTHHTITGIYNLEGYCVSNTFLGNSSNKLISYCQFFRNGVLEIFSRTANMFSRLEDSDLNIEESMIYSEFLFSTLTGLNSIKELQVEPPFLLYLSICNVPNRYFVKEGGVVIGQFSSEDIYLPAVILNTLDIDIKMLFNLIKPNLDIIYQTAGKPRSADFEKVLKQFF